MSAGACILERRELQRPGRMRQGDELGGHPFQRWLGEWRARQADGWDVTVLVALDGTHVVALAYRPEDWA